VLDEQSVAGQLLLPQAENPVHIWSFYSRLPFSFQIIVAIYVFRESWTGGDRRLLQASILVFVPAVLKCLEKPWALRRATLSSIASTWGSKQVDEEEDTAGTGNKISSPNGFIKAAIEIVKTTEKVTPPPPDHTVKGKPFHLFADLAHPYSTRLRNLEYMLQRRRKVRDRVGAGLSRTFDRLYTKYRAFGSAALRGVLVLLTFVAIRLFHQSRRGAAYDSTDVKVTYALLCCTAALEFISAGTMARFTVMRRPQCILARRRVRRRCGT
jgi:hypothetical protein